MPRPLPSYRHHKPSGRAVVTLDGKDYYLGGFDSPESHQAYHRLLAEWLEARRTREPAASPSSLTIAELLLAFWRHAAAHYRHPDGTASEEMGNLKAAIRPLRELYALTPAVDFGPLALRAVRSEMIRSGLTRTGINGRINRIRRIFRWASSVELVPVTVVQALESVDGLQAGRTEAREKDPVGPVALAVVEATLPYLARPVAALVRLQLLTGMRPGEACAMRGRDLEPGDPDWTYRPPSHKTAWSGKARTVPLGPKARALVEEFLGSDPEACLFRPTDSVADHHATRSSARKSKATPSEKRKKAASPGSSHSSRYRRSTYLQAIVRACDRAFPHPTLGGIRPGKLTDEQRGEVLAWRKAHRWHPNQLRHTVATEVRARFGLEAAQVVLGHSRADVTQVYAERDLARAREVMREIG